MSIHESVKLHRWVFPDDGGVDEWEICTRRCSGEDNVDPKERCGYQHFVFTAKTWMPEEKP